MQNIDLFCSIRNTSDPHVKLLRTLQNTIINAMKLNESNQSNINKQHDEINDYLKQINDEKNKCERKNTVISRMKGEISELADALEGQFLKNKRLISCNEEQCHKINEYLETLQILECKLSNTETQCNDLTMYNTELENNLFKAHSDNSEKSDLILDLQEKLQDYNSKVEELHFQLTSSINEIAQFKDEHYALNQTIEKLNYDNSILKIELKSINLKLNVSKELSNIKIDENQILIRKIESLTNSIDDLEKTQAYSTNEKNSLIEKSIEDGLELLCSINKMHLLECEIKRCEENIYDLNNSLECAMTKENNIRKELEICNSKLITETEDNKDLRLQLIDMQNNFDNASKKLTCFQQQLQDTSLKLDKELMTKENGKGEYGHHGHQENICNCDGIKSQSSKCIQTDLFNNIETRVVIQKESPAIVCRTAIAKKENKSTITSNTKYRPISSLAIINQPVWHSESNLSIRRNSKLSESNVSSSVSNRTCCSCTVDSNKSMCDCISNYLKKVERQLPNELDAIEQKGKQYMKKVLELEELLKNKSRGSISVLYTPLKLDSLIKKTTLF